MSGGWFTIESISAFVAGAAGVGGVWLKGKGSREARFNARYDERFKALEAKVEECDRERPYILIMAWGMKLIVAEAQARDSSNPVLKQVKKAFEALPATENVGINDLLVQLNSIPWEQAQ